MAREVIGSVLVVDGGTRSEVRARVVEVEAYLGSADPASHAFRGPTPRSRVMFGAPGHLYVYLSHGMHHCANLVCAPDGVAAAVLLRAAMVEAGERVVRERRGDQLIATHRLLSGPGNLCRGLGIGATDNGADTCGGGRLHLEDGGGTARVASGPRVGISRATDLPLRFWEEDHPAVSGRRGPAAAASASAPPHEKGPAVRPVP